MSKRYDVIIIGSGPNGLTAATLLSKRGKKVLVLEKRRSFGGLAAASEFHPGYKTPGILNDTTQLRRWVVDQLDLKKHGLQFRDDAPPVFIPAKDGRGLLLWRDAKKMEEELSSKKDVDSYRDYRAYFERVSPFLKRVFDEFPPDVMTMSFPGLWDLFKKAVSFRMLGKADMMDILRIGPMCVADWMNEWFDNDLLKAGLSGPAIHSTFTGPWSPGTNANLLLAESLYAPPVKGGAQAVVTAMIAAAKGAGVELRGDAEVAEVIIDANDRVTGVRLQNGDVILAAKVAAACDPKQLFLKLMPPSVLTQNFERNIQNIRARGTTGKVHLAVDRLPEWNGRPSLKAEYIRTGEYLDQMERSFDAVKYRQMSEEPLLDIYIPTLEAPELAPAGKHVLSIGVHFAPYALAGGWTDAARETLSERTLKALEAYAPGIRNTIVGKEVLSPKDLEDQFNLTGGHLHHGEHAADQLLVRPTPECSRYATPFAGLFLCGGGAHPGGGVTGAPGALSVRAILD